MDYRKIFLCTCVAGCFFVAFAQNKPGASPLKEDTSAVNSLLLLSKNNFGADPDKAITYSLQAKQLAEKIDFKKGAALALKNIGIANYYQGKNAEALDYYQQSLKIFQSLNDDIGISNLENNIGAIYMNQGDDAKALEYILKSLEIAEKTGDKLRILTAITNVGAIYSHNDSTLDKALLYDLKALPLAEEFGEKEAIGTISGNIGSIYIEQKNDSLALIYLKKSLKVFGNSENSPGPYNEIGKMYLNQKRYELALQNHRQALAIATRLDGKLDIVLSLQGMGNAYVQIGDRVAALRYFKDAISLAKQIGATLQLNQLYQAAAVCYTLLGDYKNAYLFRTIYEQYSDTLYYNDKGKKIANLQFAYDQKEATDSIALLQKNNEVGTLQLRNQRIAKNSLIVGLLLASVLAFFIYRNYRIKAKSNKILDRQNAEIERLLLNILPSEVAKELQLTGQATPRYYESVSVLFTDFKGFTTIADKMTPAEVVKELNTCFIAFDNIVDKYKLEKIKTIGDSYMCAGGISGDNEDHVCNTVTASLAMLSFIDNYNQNRIENGLAVWDIRIGIHVGPVMAGVVGKKKYAYDIWGSTVNIASRMESNGMAGMVNISKDTYEQVKNNYACDHRGKIYAKNVGEIDMYFVKNEIVHAAKNTQDGEVSGFAKKIKEPNLNTGIIIKKD